MEIILANPRGFCAGVKRAIAIVEHALKFYKSTIYVKHELVHNQYVIKDFKKKGIIFIENILDVPDHSVIVFSAHGVSKQVEQQAIKKKLIILNATCPLVKKVHVEVSKASKKSIETILIGHQGHPEIIGTLSRYDNKKRKIHLIENIQDIKKLKIDKNKKIKFFTQTTLSVNNTKSIISALRNKFPNISGPKTEDICYATTNRQKAMIQLTQISDIIFVIGSKNSSNSNRLTELGKEMKVPTKQIESFLDIKKKWLKNIKYIGVTAGASAPNILIEEVIKHLKKIGAKNIREIQGIKEEKIFKIPKNLIYMKKK
ncbi:4-hydroxy-3-methylbut-2-enyl diphosphate reductase [Buchnera aphidicola (Melanaphis sacchari)]|uniref:4-hydroxy-3-methylbut-2-enyl diphosphate reductase n=1 Tax=Buchnera aphidicola (Melanaphis sacchari) TaxID=2173854 RepID=A0A2U8DFN9_9GAMM|nr:4-hydroxy-3-methylbut-2-enyl diphosphate reductase [Buchnera aphidicola]AWH90619.1 4-hydroxy-3-methylbut-2-enyl diphosphate reductase [Buchnera aphidicola (Melanaphis sacchari)]